MRIGRTLAVLALGATLAACSDARGPVGIGTTTGTVSASGRVYPATGTIPTGARVVIAAGSRRVSSSIRADGTFSVTGQVEGPHADVYIEAEGMHPSLARVFVGTPAPPLQFVLVPRRWTIRGGVYDGTTVDISLDAGFRPPCSTAGDTNCDGFYPVAWTGMPRLWPRAALPIRVAFDHAAPHGEPISAADSVAFWNIVQRMNSDYGTAIFRPARANEIAVTNDRPQQGIFVRVDTTLAGFGAWTNWWWNGAGEMYSAVVRPRRASFVRSSSLMTHELLHTQGFKHSCSWSTVMGGYGCGSATGLSAHDIAYAQLAVQVESVQRMSGAAHSLAAARDGERAITLGLPLPSSARALAFSAVRGDSIGDADGDHAHALISHRRR